MPYAFVPPPRVRCNRGLGFVFWAVLVVVCLVAAVVAGRAQLPVWAGFGIGAALIVLIILVRLRILPRLEILVADGLLRTERHTVPFSQIAEVRFSPRHHSERWASFLAEDGTTLAKMALANTMFATPTAEQWAGLHAAIRGAGIARGVHPDAQPPLPGHWPPGRALDVLADQVEWCRAGHRSTSLRAPARALRWQAIVLDPDLPH